MYIEAINGGWFYDDVTARGISFDAFLPQACKTPLGNMQEFELIHTPERMANFHNNDWYRKNWSLADTLTTFSPLKLDKHVLVDAYRKEMADILSAPCDSECCEHDASCGAWPTRGSCRGLRVLHKDLSRYGDVMTGSNELDDGKFYDVKKEIYRLTDRVFAALAKCYEVKASGTFAILDELYKKEVISSEARDNFASASAIAIKLRISTYLKAGKQGEQLSASLNQETGKLTSAYHMPKAEELFHFFFIAIPLYEELQQFKTAGTMPSSLKHRSFFDDSDITMGHVYCRLLNYDEALKCYERALRQNPENLIAEIRRIRVALVIVKNAKESDSVRENLENMLSKVDENFSQLHRNVNQTTLESTSFINGLSIDECRQLLEVLLFAATFYDCQKYTIVAREILTQYLTARECKPRELLIMKFEFMNYFPEDLVEQSEIDAATSQLIALIDEEGVSMKSIAWLKRLGKFLFYQDKLDRAYCCFQRALSMEHLLYGTKANVNMMTSLRFLGMISMGLSMYAESKFYLQSLVQQFESFGGVNTKLVVKETYLLLAFFGTGMLYSTEETVSHVEKGLKVTTDSRNDRELRLDCFLHRELATMWHARQNPEQAWKAALDAQACLRNLTEIETRVAMTCFVARLLCQIKKTSEGIVLLKEELQKLTLGSQVEQKAICLKFLGKLCVEQGLTADAKNYYAQALDAVVDTKNENCVLDGLDCLIGISKALMMEGRMCEAKTGLDQAFSLAKKLHSSNKKCSFLKHIGKLCKNLGEIGRARLCYDEALRTCKKETNVSKELLLTEINLEMKLGDLVDNGFTIGSDPELGMPHAQRSHYVRAAEMLQQHVVTGQVDTKTVVFFASLAMKYSLVDSGEKIRLLLEALKVSEIVYRTNNSNELITKILGQLSDEHFVTGDVQSSIKYRESLMRVEMELHLSNPFHERISNNLMMWAFYSLSTPGGIEAVESVHEFLLSARKGKDLTNSTTKANAARCFTFLSVLFYTLGDLEKAETLNEMASQLFSEIRECIETEKLPWQKTSDLMKTEILPSKKVLSSSHTKKLICSFGEVFAADSRNDKANVEEFPREFQPIATEKSSLDSVEPNSLNSPRNRKNLQQEICNERARDQKLDKNQPRSTLAKDQKMSENCSDGQENLKSLVSSSDGAKLEETDSSDPKATNDLTQTLPEISFPVLLESFSDKLLRPELIELTIRYFSLKAVEMFPALPSLLSQLDALDYNKNKGNVKRTAEIYASLQPQLVSFYGNSPFDGDEKLITDAIRAKEDNRPSSAIMFLDLALKLPSNWKRKAKIIKLRGECLLSRGDFRTAAINFTEAVSIYSRETVDDRDILREYSEVLIGLIKSEMLCKNVAEAWLIFQKGIKLSSDHDLKEAINLQAVEFFYLGAKCANILSESGEDQDNKLAQACSLCQQALTLSQRIEQTMDAGDLMEELGSSGRGEIFATKWEAQLLLAAIFRKLQNEEEAEAILQEMKKFFMNNVDFELSANSMSGGKPEFQKICGRVFSCIGRILVMLDEMELSITWLNKSLVAFFSVVLPDNLLSFYEEFLPLLQAITVAKSSAAHESRSPFQRAVDMCKETSLKQGNDLGNVYHFLGNLAKVYTHLGRTEEALVLAESALGITDLICGGNVSDNIINRVKMLLYFAQIHQLNSTNSAFNTDEESNLAERYYLTDRGSSENLTKDLSYANFLYERKRFGEADAVLRDMSNLGKLVWDKYVYVDYFSRVFYGTSVEESVKIDGELLTTVGDVMCCIMVQVFVGMRKKKEAVAACEHLTAVNSLDVHEAMCGKRPSCKPYLVKACHRQLLFLLSEKNRKQFEKCDLPLSPTNLVKLYYMLEEYVSASKYLPKEVESPELLEMKISCLRLAGNELVGLDRGKESLLYFTRFLGMLQAKEGFLDLSFHDQCEVLERYYFANHYYLFYSLGSTHSKRGNIDAAIQCYERCLDLDENSFTCDQNIVATLADLYQSKALAVDLKIDQDSWKTQMDLAFNLFEKLFQKTEELTPFVELTFGSLLSRLERYNEAVEHFDNAFKKANFKSNIISMNVDKPLADAYLRHEIEVRSGGITIPLQVLALYDLILTYMKLNEMGKVQEVAFLLESYVKRYEFTPMYLLALSMVGYAHRLIGNKEKAAEIFVSVLEFIPGHPPVTEALESCCM